MRAAAADYELVSPETLAEALALLAADPGAYRPLAGGTDLMVLYSSGKLAHRRFASPIGEAPFALVVGVDHVEAGQAPFDGLNQAAIDAYLVRQNEKWAEGKRNAEQLPANLRERLMRARDEPISTKQSSVEFCAGSRL